MQNIGAPGSIPKGEKGPYVCWGALSTPRELAKTSRNLAEGGPPRGVFSTTTLRLPSGGFKKKELFLLTEGVYHKQRTLSGGTRGTPP